MISAGKILYTIPMVILQPISVTVLVPEMAPIKALVPVY